MIVSMSSLRKKLKEGNLTVDGLVKEIEFRNTVADNVLGLVLSMNRELEEAKKIAKEMAALESEDDTADRKEMLEKLKSDLETLPTEKLQEMLSNLRSSG